MPLQPPHVVMHNPLPFRLPQRPRAFNCAQVGKESVQPVAHAAP